MKLIIVTVFISLLIGYGYLKFNELTRPLPPPAFDIRKYWGPGDGKNYKEDETIKPFTINRTAEEIADLKSLLDRNIKLTEPLEGVRFEYGYNTKALGNIVKYWSNEYLSKWTERQEFLNQYPQYTTEIQGLRIHYMHVKPTAAALKKKQQVIPLLLLHGWPGSVREFYKLMPLLTNNTQIDEVKYAFKVVAPSLVGYGWSQAAAKPGFDAVQMAIVMRNLMMRLGYEKFLIQGGDWGAVIGANIATLFPQNVIGYHSNMCTLATPLALMKAFVASFYPEKFTQFPHFVGHYFPVSDKMAYMLRESGYFHMQATKPDTIGIALMNHPIGLAAYILEKFQTAVGPKKDYRLSAAGDLFGLDDVLDNIMIYYLSGTATSAGRFYKENMLNGAETWRHMERVPTSVPMGCARFKNDLPGALDWQLRDKFTNVLHSRYFLEGGHFIAMELPHVLYLDFAEFVRKIHKNK